MTLADIDKVITRLDEIIEAAIDEKDRIGYFAAMYQKVTRAVRDAIVDDQFDDGDRMARFDFVFAERFIAAYDTHRSGHQPTKSWGLAFAAASERRLLILQHLLIGMNAHINLDLGIAAAHVAPPGGIELLRPDFNKINDVLGDLVNGFQASVGSLSPWIDWLDRFAGGAEDELIRFSISHARDDAWRMAVVLTAPEANEARIIAERDAITSAIGNGIRRPGLLAPVTLAIRVRESNDVAAVINQLRQ